LDSTRTRGPSRPWVLRTRQSTVLLVRVGSANAWSTRCGVSSSVDQWACACLEARARAQTGSRGAAARGRWSIHLAPVAHVCCGPWGPSTRPPWRRPSSAKSRAPVRASKSPAMSRSTFIVRGPIELARNDRTTVTFPAQLSSAPRRLVCGGCCLTAGRRGAKRERDGVMALGFLRGANTIGPLAIDLVPPEPSLARGLHGRSRRPCSRSVERSG